MASNVRIVIAGGGIGGLTAAMCLHAAGHDVHVYESVVDPGELGVGINVLPHSVRVLDDLGLLPALDEIGVRTGALLFLSRDGTRIWSEKRGLDAGNPWPQFSVHRGQFHMLLWRAALERLGPDRLHRGHRLISFDQPDNESVISTFADRTVSPAANTSADSPSTSTTSRTSRTANTTTATASTANTTANTSADSPSTSTTSRTSRTTNTTTATASTASTSRTASTTSRTTNTTTATASTSSTGTTSRTSTGSTGSTGSTARATRASRASRAGRAGEVIVESDVLIGADGIHSAVRQQLYPDQGTPRPSGLVLWRGAVRAPAFLDGRTMFMAGDDDQKAVVYPISNPDDSGNALINWVAERPLDVDMSTVSWNRGVDVATVASYFESWDYGWLNVGELIASSDAAYEFPMVDRDPVERWSHGRVTLLGDAAHPMRPNGSNGSSQAILDGEAITAALNGTASNNTPSNDTRLTDTRSNAVALHDTALNDTRPNAAAPNDTAPNDTESNDAASAGAHSRVGTSGLVPGRIPAGTHRTIADALIAYETERLDPTARLTIANRQAGPERVMQWVADRCDGRCGDHHVCVPDGELEREANAYKQLAGFDLQHLQSLDRPR